MNFEFLNQQQAILYFNKQTNLNVDDKTFFIYCLENKISIKYKAITEFTAILGFLISADEYIQLEEHESIEVGFDDRENNTIFAQKSFDEQVSLLTHKFSLNNFPDKYNSDLSLTKLDALVEASILVKETPEYKQLLAKKEFIDRVHQIKTAKRIILLDDKRGGLVFHEKNIFLMKSGIYDFLDDSLSIKGLLHRVIQSNSDDLYKSYIPTESRFFFSDNMCYWKAEKRENRIYEDSYTDGIFQQGFLKNDIDILIKKLLKKEKSINEIDVLHPRTANNASKIISALCELNGLDITQPYGKTNNEIMNQLERLGVPLSKDVIGDWLKLAHENTK